MSIISVRVNDDEMAILKEASKLYDCGMSSMIKRLTFEKLEDEFDMKIISDYESAKAKGTLETRPIEVLCKELFL